LAVVEDDAGIGVVHSVVEVITSLAVAAGLADHLGDGRARGGDQKTARLGEDFEILREEPIQLGVDSPGKRLERLHLGVVRGGETAGRCQSALDGSRGRPASRYTPAARFSACT